MDNDFKLHAGIGIKSKEIPSLKLWYLCRAYDTKGSGKVVIPTKEVLKELGCSRTTLWRYLSDERVVRSYKSIKGELIIYYVSLKKLCVDLDIRNIGAIGNVNTVKDIYGNSILITALWLQGLSEHIAKSENKPAAITKKNSKNKRLGNPEIKTRYKYHNNPTKYFDQEGNALTSHMCRGAMVSTSEKNTTGLLGVVHVFENKNGITNFILSSNVLPYGASYEGIAKALKITPKTIGTYLRQVPRIRTILRPTDHYCSKARFLATEDVLGQNPTKGYYYDYKGRFFKYHTNIYYPSITLSSQAQLRKQVHRVVDESRSPG